MGAVAIVACLAAVLQTLLQTQGKLNLYIDINTAQNARVYGNAYINMYMRAMIYYIDIYVV